MVPGGSTPQEKDSDPEYEGWEDNGEDWPGMPDIRGMQDRQSGYQELNLGSWKNERLSRLMSVIMTLPTVIFHLASLFQISELIFFA